MKHTLRFEIRKEAQNNEGKCPISGIVSVKGKRKRLKTDLTVYPWNWDQSLRKAVYRSSSELKSFGVEKKKFIPLGSEEVKEINDQLESIRLKLVEIERIFEIEKKPYGSELLVVTFLNERNDLRIVEEPKTLIYDFIDQYIRENEKTRAKGSLVVYKSLRKHLKNFENYKKNRVRFESINYGFMQSFQNFLVDWQETNPKTGTINALNNVTIHKQISTLKTFLAYAKKHGILIDESYRTFTMKKGELEVIALTQREFDSLLELDLSENAKLDKVRDVFCFSCATGLRYSDLKNLRWEHIKGMELRFRVQKTNQLLQVPLAPQAYEILEKYQDMAYPLPVISNQKMNDYLKDLGKLAEINDPVEIVRYRGAKKMVNVYPKYELISAHTGRKTFATLSLEKGIPAETVMSITGHKSYASFQRYVKVTEDRKRNEMAKAWGKPELKKAIGGL